MRVLNICIKSPFSEGFNYQDNLLPEYQHILGHDVTILTGTRSRDKQGKFIDVPPVKKTLDNGVHLIRIESGGKLRRFLGYYPRIERIINEISPDLIFIHSLCTFVPIQAVSYKKKHRNVILVADNHQDYLNSKITGFPFRQTMMLWRYMWKRLILYFSHIYGTTSWRTEFAIKEYGIPREKADTLVMGIDSARLPQNKDAVREEIRSDLGVLKNNFLFITGGKISTRFHRMEAIHAFSEFASSNSRLLVFGSVEDSLKNEFKELLQSDKRIIYIGFVDSKEINRYFYASDFGLFPGAHSVLWEEAIGCALPCLFSKYEKNDHMQVCGNCVQIEQNATPTAIAEVINKVETQEDFYKEMKRNADKAAPLFSYYEIAKKSIR